MRKSLLVYFFLLLTLYNVNALSANAFFKKNKKEIKNEEKQVLKVDSAYLELEGDNVEFDQEKNIYTTKGMAVANLLDQGTTLEADEIIYYGVKDEVEAHGNIMIIKSKVVTTGEDFKYKVSSDSYTLQNPITTVMGAMITAREAVNFDGNNLEYKNGTLKLDEPLRIAQGFGARRNPPSFYSRRRARASKTKPTWADISTKERYKVTANKIIYDTNKKLRNLTIYGGKLHFKHFSLPVLPKFTTTISSDPNVRSAPLITPVLGTQGALGGFAVGPNLNINVNDHHILSFAPFAQIGSRGNTFGFGGKIGFHGPKSSIEGAYGSLKNRFILRAVQTIGNKTQVRLAHYQYLDDGFIGSTLTKYIAEIVDRRRLSVPFTESGINFRSSIGWIETAPGITPTRYGNFLQDATKKHGKIPLFRKSAFKFQEQINIVSKPIIKLGNDKFNTALRVRTRDAFRIYSTGDTQEIFTAGPLLDNVAGPLSFEVGYIQGFSIGKSPLIYDQYIQGMQSLALDGDLRIFEGLTIGGYGTYNIKQKDLVERQFRAKIGPKDFKLLVNWDALRQQTQFGVNFLFGQPVDFEKFVILNSRNRSGGI